MGVFKKIGRFIGKYFAFVGGLLFIFTLGVIYAFIKPQDNLVNGIFLILGIGWIIFIIKYFWDLVEKKDLKEISDEGSFDINITKSSESTPPDTNKPN